jgi:hypothetical protein
MVYHFNIAEPCAMRRGERAYLLFIAEQGNARDTLFGAETGGDHRARVFAFRQDYVLHIAGGALT